MQHLDTNGMHGEKSECYVLFWTNLRNDNSRGSSCTANYIPSHKAFKWNELHMWGIIGKVKKKLISNVTFWMGPWCNGYCRRKWTRRLEFKTWTRLIAFHVAQIPLGKVWIQLFSLQLWVNGRTDRVLQPWWGNSSRRRKTEFKPVKLRLKIDRVSYPARVEGLGK